MDKTIEAVESLATVDLENTTEYQVDGYSVSELTGSGPLMIDIPRKWLVDEGWAISFLQTINNLNEAQLVELRTAQAERSVNQYTVRDKVAYIELNGTLMKKPSSFNMGGSYVEARMALRSALKDEDVKNIVFQIYSPGGQDSGAFDLADDIYRFSKVKPIYAYCEDIACSAAYLIASQCLHICGNVNLHGGSIGVYTTLTDSSKAAEDQGYKVHVIKAGDLKAVGVPGTKVTDAQLKIIQKEVDSIHSLFVKYVKRGRNLTNEQLVKVVDASVYVGQENVKVGLVDKICSIDDFHMGVTDGKFPSERKGMQMSVELSDVDRWLGEQPVAEPITSVENQVNESSVISGFLQKNNVKDEAHLQDLIKQAAFGREQETRIREQVAALAVVALDADAGADAKKLIDTLPINMVQDLGKQYINIGQQKKLIGQDGVPIVRATAGNNVGDDGPVSSSNNGVDKEASIQKNAEFLISQDRAGQYVPFL